MVESKVMNAGLYIRVSTERQVKEGYSVPAQKENLTKFAKQQGWNIFDIYADEGISGKNIKDRPNVKRLFEDIKNNKIDVVLLYKFDRLTRDSKDTEDIIELIQNCGIQVITLSGGNVDVSTATGRFTVRINGAVAQLEREQTIERVKVAFVQKVKEGYSLCSGVTCYGYNRKKHEKELTINKDEAKIVKRVFKLYNDGKSFTEICNILNTEKIPTKNYGKEKINSKTGEIYTVKSIWMPKTIRLMLTNVMYIGYVRYHIGKKDEFNEKGKHEPIISMKVWNKTQDRIDKIKHVSRTNLPKDDVYYCGTLVCGICGHKLTTNRTVKIKKDGTKVTFNGYRCVNREKKLCTCLGVSHNKVENAFLDYIDNIEEFTEFENVQIEEDLEELESMKRDLNQIMSKKKEVMNLFMNDSITHEQLQYMTSELDKKYELIKKEVERLERLIQPKKDINKNDIAKNIKQHWQYLSNREKLEFLNTFVKEIIIINKDKDKINGKPEILNVNFYED